jgi:hypothetical protein
VISSRVQLDPERRRRTAWIAARIAANRDPSEQFAAHSRRFPVPSRKYPVLWKKIPVRSHREFGWQVVEDTYQNDIKINLKGRFSRNSLFFSLLAGKAPSRDWSECDCLRHHAFLRNSGFMASPE